MADVTTGALGRLSGETIGRVLDGLVGIGNRFVGTPGEAQARAWIREELVRVGLTDVREEPVEALGYVFGGASLALADTGLSLPAVGLQSTASAEVEAEAVFLGRPTTVDDIDALVADGCRVEGRIAVIQTFWPFGFGEHLTRLGAAGIVVISENPDGQIGHYVAQLYPVAEPPDFAGRPLGVPGVTVDLRDGQRLLALLTAGRTRLRIRHECEYPRVTTANVVGEVRGTSRPDELVVVGAHYDTQLDGVGASDNASGIASVIATAERWAERPAARTGVFVAFADEEHGFLGSVQFCRRHREALRRAALMLNFDALAWKHAWGHSLWVDPAIEAEAARLLTDVGWVPEEIVEASWFPGSDHNPFIDAGVPAMWLWRFPPQHPYYHAAGDTLDLIDVPKLVETASAGAHVARAIADDEAFVLRPSAPVHRWIDFG